MVFRIMERTYRPARPGEDFGEDEYTEVARIDAADKRSAQREFKKKNPTARFDKDRGRFVAWSAH